VVFGRSGAEENANKKPLVPMHEGLARRGLRRSGLRDALNNEYELAHASSLPRCSAPFNDPGRLSQYVGSASARADGRAINPGANGREPEQGSAATQSRPPADLCT